MAKSTIEDLEQNPQLEKLVKDNRISLLNAVEDLALVLVDQIADDQTKSEGFDAVLNIDEALEQFRIISMTDLSEEEINRQIQELQDQGVNVNIIEVNDAVERLVKEHQQHQARKVVFLFIAFSWRKNLMRNQMKRILQLRKSTIPTQTLTLTPNLPLNPKRPSLERSPSEKPQFHMS